MESTTEVIAIVLKQGPPIVEKLLFSWYDHTLFALMLGVSALIGIYFGFCGKKQNTVDEYILGGKNMRPFPVAMSLVASRTSAITLLAVPADIYLFGASFWLCTIAVLITGLFTNYIYLPVFHKLQLTSSYEYLKYRFDKRIRTLASFLFVVAMLLHLPIVIYIPALAFAQVTNVNIHMITPIVCAICIFYTTLGGLKAVVWTDTLQFSIMIIAMVVVLFLGFNATNGVKYVFETAYEGGRLYLWDMNPDPTIRTSFWSVVVGLSVSWTAQLGVNQSYVQKFLSLPTISGAKRSIVIYIIGTIIVNSISTITGLIIYAKYVNCDPIKVGSVQRADQLLPYFIMDVAGKIPGLPGLFIAGVFCAALRLVGQRHSICTLSAYLNTLSGVIYEDCIKSFMPKNTTEKRASDILKLIVVLIGIISTATVFIVEYLGNILPLVISVHGIANGPLLGLFTLGMLVPFANSKGALTGTLSSLLIMGWIIFGAQYHKSQGALITPKLSTSIDGCDVSIIDALTNTTTMLEDVLYNPPWIYKVSFYYYGLMGCTITLVVGSVISLLTGGKNQRINKDLLSPVIHFLLPKEHKMEYKTVANAMEFIAKDNLSNEKEAIKK